MESFLNLCLFCWQFLNLEHLWMCKIGLCCVWVRQRGCLKPYQRWHRVNVTLMQFSYIEVHQKSQEERADQHRAPLTWIGGASFFISHLWLSCCNANFKKRSQASLSCQPRLIVHRHLMMVPAALSFGCVHKPGWLTSSFHVFVHSFVTADRKCSICLPVGSLSEIREAPHPILFDMSDVNHSPHFLALSHASILLKAAVWRVGKT